jgi:hypothetical protein
LAKYTINERRKVGRGHKQFLVLASVAATVISVTVGIRPALQYLAVKGGNADDEQYDSARGADQKLLVLGETEPVNYAWIPAGEDAPAWGVRSVN